jgi:hypothetical protein
MYSVLDLFRKLLEELENYNNRAMDWFYLISRKQGVNIAYLSFAFVFIYFGLQKPLPVVSPVDTNISLLAYNIGVSSSFAIYFVGLYEIFLGFLFLFRLIKYAFWFFLAHQIVAFSTLLLLSKNAFQPPWITFLGLEMPWLLNGYSAFVLKNLVFVACFMLLFSAEYGD